MKWKLRLGPQLAEPPTDLDEDSQERLDSFLFYAGHGPTVRISKLLWLAVVSSPETDFGAGRFKRSGEVLSLAPHTVVLTTQRAVGSRRVAFYIEQLRAGADIGTVRVTDTEPSRGPAGWWHLDGLHRLLAARILGQAIDAEIWR